MALTIACACGQQYAVEERYAGQQVPCTLCGRTLLIPYPSTPTGTLACACGQHYAVDPRHAGQQVPCPACGRTLTIPAAPPSVVQGGDPWSVPLEEPAPARSRSWLVGVVVALVVLVLFTGGLLGTGYVLFLRLKDNPLALVGTPDEPETPQQPNTSTPVKDPEKPKDPPREKEPDKPNTPVPPPPPPPRPRILPPPSREPWKGHLSRIVQIAFGRDGQAVWTAAGGVEEKDGKPNTAHDSTMRLWDAPSGKEKGRIERFEEGIAAAAFSTDGSLAAIAPALGEGAARGEIELVDVRKKSKVRTLTGHSKPVRCLAFSTTAQQLLSGAEDNRILVWDVASGKRLQELVGHTNAVNQVVFSSDGRLALSGGMDHTARVWDLDTGKQRFQLAGHTDIVWSIALSPNGRWAATGAGMQNLPGLGLTAGSRDHDIRLWDLTTGKESKRLVGHTGPVTALAFNPASSRLLSGGHDGSVRLWQVDTGKELTRLTDHTGRVTALAFFPDNRQALSASDTGVLRTARLPLELSELVQDLRGADVRGRLAALAELDKRREEARSAVPVLFEVVTGKDEEVRRSVLALLRALSPLGKEHVLRLVRLLEDRSFPDGRRFALDALTGLGEEARPAARALLAAVTDGDAVTRRQAILALAPVVQEVSRDAFKPLVAALSDGDATVRQAAESALGKLGPPSEDQVPELRRLLSSNAEAGRRYAVRALTTLAGRASAVVPDLAVRVAKDSLAALRRDALAALARIAPADTQTVLAAERALEDRDRDVARQAVRTLAAARAVPGLLKALGHADAEVAKMAGEGLEGVKYDLRHVKALAGLLGSDRPAVRQRAVEGLGKLGGDAAAAVEALERLLRKAEGEERLRVLATLGRIGSAAATAGPSIAELLREKDRSLRYEVCHVLIQIEAAEVTRAVAVLREALRPAEESEVEDEEAKKQRERARSLLVKVGKQAVRPLVTALEREWAGGRGSAGMLNATARLEAIQTLVEIGRAAGSNDVLLALVRLERVDPFPAVRQAAREARIKLQRKDG